MNRRFGDGPFSRLLSALFDLVIINVLCVVCSLPIFTAGAALSGGFLAARTVLLDGGTGAVRVFFTGFKENFRQATLLWLGSLVVAAALYCDLLLLRLYFEGTLYTVLLAVLALVLFIFLAVLAYAIPLITRYKNTLREHLHNAFILSVICFPRTLLMVLLHALPFILFFMLPVAFLYTLVFWLLLGVSFILMMDAILLREVFNRLERGELGSR